MSNRTSVDSSEERKGHTILIYAYMHKLPMIDKDLNILILMPTQPNTTQKACSLYYVGMLKAHLESKRVSFLTINVRLYKAISLDLYLLISNLKAFKKEGLPAPWLFQIRIDIIIKGKVKRKIT